MISQSAETAAFSDPSDTSIDPGFTAEVAKGITDDMIDWAPAVDGVDEVSSFPEGTGFQTSEVKITIVGKLAQKVGRTILPPVEVTTVNLGADGKLTANTPLGPQEYNIPALLVPSSMTPVSSEVIVNNMNDLAGAIAHEAIRILIAAWLEAGDDYLRGLYQLPLQSRGLVNVPAIPIQLAGMLVTLLKLTIRSKESQPAKNGLTHQYTLDNETATAYEFLYGKTPSTEEEDDRNQLIRSLRRDPNQVLKSRFDQALRESDNEEVTAEARSLTTLPLEQPEQWSMSWTTFQDIHEKASPRLPDWASSLTDAAQASKLFWPTIASYGLPYNLLILQKVGEPQIAGLKSSFQSAWSHELDTSYAEGNLYVIDLSIFETVKPQRVAGCDRFTPATVTLLVQDPQSKALTPTAVRVSGHGGGGEQVYTRAGATDAAWLYALQAAKTSITVYGIWLGHVYHWHIVTAAMQMTLYKNVPDDHAIHQLLAPQSHFLIPFDDVLLLLWKHAAPPTSISSARQFLELTDTFASSRTFFDDDPTTALANLGLEEADFTVREPWDQYLIVRYLLNVWNATEEYVKVFVDTSYKSDQAVAEDSALQAWISASGDRRQGNVRGLPTVDSRPALTRVLTSLLYRVTVHGVSRLNSAANPALTFVANFPPCLQKTSIPEPSSDFGTRELLEFLPRTGTIGGMVDFYFTFVFSTPYKPFIPSDGIESNLFFPDGLNDPRNQALVRFREAVGEFIEMYERESSWDIQWPPQRFQWPLNIET